jgi:hypothetical protein
MNNEYNQTQMNKNLREAIVQERAELWRMLSALDVLENAYFTPPPPDNEVHSRKPRKAEEVAKPVKVVKYKTPFGQPEKKENRTGLITRKDGESDLVFKARYAKAYYHMKRSKKISNEIVRQANPVKVVKKVKKVKTEDEDTFDPDKHFDPREMSKHYA